MSAWGYRREDVDEEEKKRREAERSMLLMRFLSTEARQRLRNISLVKPDLAKQVEDLIIKLGLEGRIDHPLSDEEFKNILRKIQSVSRRGYNIKF